MPLMQGKTSVAAATVDANVITGQIWERAPYNALLEIGLMGDTNGADLRVTVHSGADALCDNTQIGIKDAFPVYPDDYVLNDVIGIGERLKLAVRNLHATTARSIYWSVRVTPV